MLLLRGAGVTFVGTVCIFSGNGVARSMLAPMCRDACLHLVAEWPPGCAPTPAVLLSRWDVLLNTAAPAPLNCLAGPPRLAWPLSLCKLILSVSFLTLAKADSSRTRPSYSCYGDCSPDHIPHHRPTVDQPGLSTGPWEDPTRIWPLRPQGPLGKAALPYVGLTPVVLTGVRFMPCTQH